VVRSLLGRIQASVEVTEGSEAIALERVQALAREFGVSAREVELAALEARILPRRYLRSLGTVGWEGQIKLLRSTVGRGPTRGGPPGGGGGGGGVGGEAWSRGWPVWGWVG
jgi:hypothetical protein